MWYPVLTKYEMPSKSFVYGEEDKKLLIQTFNYPEESIEVVGSVNLENVEEESTCNSNSKLIDKYEKQDKKIVLFIQSIIRDDIIDKRIKDYNNYFLSYYNNLIRSLRKYDINIILKFHPNVNISFFKQKLIISDQIILTNKINLMKLINISDLVISEPSTAILSAIVKKKPIIKLNIIDNLKRDINFYNSEIGKECTSFNKLEYYIDLFLNNKLIINQKIYHNVIKQYMNQNNPSDQIAKYISRL